MKPDNINFKPVDFDPFSEKGLITFHTTDSQREIWTNIQIGGHDANCAYNESVSLDLSGKLNPQALQEAVNILFQRHDALRATISDDGIWMRIHPYTKKEIIQYDFSSDSESDRNSKIDNELIAEAETEFDLTNGPLSRLKLIKKTNDQYRLILSFHHIICDGWSLGILLQELSQIYSSIIDNRVYSESPALSFQKYSEAEDRFKESEEFNKVALFWLNQFKNRTIDMQLPVNNKRPGIRTYNASRIDIETDPEVIAGLRKIGAANGTSFITTLNAAFEIFLNRITGSRDVIVGLASAGQAASGFDRLVGHCVNLLLLRSEVDPELTFGEYLKIRKPQILDAYDNQRFTYGSLIQKLNIPRSPDQAPLVPVSFNVDLGLTDGVDFKGCEFTFSTNPRHYENFEIFINAAGNGNNLVFECTYNTSLFTSDMMLLRMQEFSQLLKNIIEQPSGKLGRLSILTDTETENIFNRWQGPDVDYQLSKCIHELIDESAHNHPDIIALQMDDVQVTYGELKKYSDQLSMYLIDSGVVSGSLVVLYMDRSIDVVISLIAILKAGAGYVPIDTSYPLERVKYIIDDSDAGFLITQKDYLDNLKFFEGVKYISESFSDIYKQSKGSASLPDIDLNQLAYIIYTSGSTGKPKGVAISHFALMNYISWCNNYYFNDHEGGNFPLYSSLSFDLTVTSIYCTLTRAKTLYVYQQQLEVPDILRKAFSDTSGVDSIKMTPAHILLLDALELKSKNIKIAIVGGEELTPQHVRILKSIQPVIEIFNEYGPTEATVGCIVKKVLDENDSRVIGNPIANMKAYVLDNNTAVLPPGITGNLYLGGYGLAQSYYNKPGLTDEKFRIITINNEHERLYNSGDLAWFKTNGELVFAGRSDDQVKIRGFRIELGEIESVLLKSEIVKNAVVIVYELTPGDKQLVAYLVLIPGENREVSFFEKYLQAFLPDYMIPGNFVFLEKLPLTENGKIDRKKLPAPLYSESMFSADFAEPQTPTEQLIANLWCDILSLERVGRYDNFFELGGHSLLGVKLFTEIDKQLGIKLNLSVLFTASTIKELAEVISNKGITKPVSCLVPLQKYGNRTPLFCIHMHNGNVNRWRVMVKHLGNNQPVYAIQPVGLDNTVQPHTTIEEMATYYIKVMREIQPTGPYNLIGLCFSGMVVYEMAIQLQELGEQVEYLGMINNYAPPENPKLYRIKTGLNKFMKMELGEKFNYAVNKQLDLGKKLLFKTKLLQENKNNSVEEMMVDEENSSEVGHDLRTIHSLALLNYHPQKQYKGDLFIIRTNDPIEEYYNETLGWDRLVTGKIYTTIIDDSDTDTIITDEPYNVKLSLSVKKALDDLQMGSSQ